MRYPHAWILLCADKNDTLVRYALPEDNTTILASRYQPYLPSPEELISELKREIDVVQAADVNDQ